MEHSANTKRIAKNTLFLYFRMFLIMAVTLYTSRVVLKALGVDDYGIYNVVGGIVAMLSFLTNSLTGASSRFITFAIGKNDEEELKKMVSSTKLLFVLLALFMFVVGEIVGLWFLNNKLVIAENRMEAAFWVFQFSMLTTITSILSVPYNAIIQAYEKMNAFAYISIVEALLRLAIAFAIVYSPGDKLIVYALLYAIVQIVIRSLYINYCARNFAVSSTKMSYDKELFTKISGFALWTMNGNLAHIGYTQGINILLNLFFGPIANAARAITVQVQGAVFSFVQNFLLASKPQIVKSFAQGDYDYLHKLVIASSKYGFYLIFLLCLPLLIYIDTILQIWLRTVPENTGLFVRVILLICVIQPFRQPMIDAIYATGHVKRFHIYEGSVLLTIIPIAYILLKFFHTEAVSVFIVYVVVELIAQFIRVWIVLPYIHLSYGTYLKKAVLPILPFLSTLLFLIYYQYNETVSFLMLIRNVIFIELIAVGCIYLIGINKQERKKITNSIKEKFSNKKI